jgi:hypothetical protein
MKLTPANRSAFFNLRLSTAFALCGAGCFLALAGAGAVPLPGSESHQESVKQSTRGKSSAKWRRADTAAPTTKVRGRMFAPKSSGGAPTAGAALSERAINERVGITEHRNALGQTVYSVPAAHFDVSPPLTELAKLSLPKPPKRRNTRNRSYRSRASSAQARPDPVVQVVPGSDQARGEAGPDAVEAAGTGFNFEGINGFSLDNGYPPDENGSVGNDQFVEMVNSHYQVWSINRANNTVTSIIPKTEIGTLFAGFGGACQTRNDGDPIVLYDKVANRWFLSQFTSAAVNGVFYQCVAISTTPNAAGTYYRYAFAVPNGKFGDYPHYGVWTDAYYLMSHDFTPSGSSFTFSAASFGAMDRTKMLAGDPTATYQVILDPLEGGHMPADMDGFAPPPAGSPGIFTSVHSDGMYLYRMKVDWSNAANTTRTLQAVMPIAPATAPCGGAGGQCIPQPNSAFTLDSLGDRLMFRLAYRNFLDHESLVVSHSVDPAFKALSPASAGTNSGSRVSRTPFAAVIRVLISRGPLPTCRTAARAGCHRSRRMARQHDRGVHRDRHTGAGRCTLDPLHRTRRESSAGHDDRS